MLFDYQIFKFLNAHRRVLGILVLISGQLEPDFRFIPSIYSCAREWCSWGFRCLLGGSLLSSTVQLCGERDEEEHHSRTEQNRSRSGGISDSVEGIFDREISAASHCVFHVSSEGCLFSRIRPRNWSVLSADPYVVITLCVIVYHVRYTCVYLSKKMYM